MWTWLQKLLPTLDDLQIGQTVEVRGTGPVVVTDPSPIGPHSSVFQGAVEGGEEFMYSRDEIQ